MNPKNILRADPETRCVLSTYAEPPFGRSLAETCTALLGGLKQRVATLRIALMDTKAMAPATIPAAVEKSRRISLV